MLAKNCELGSFLICAFETCKFEVISKWARKKEIRRFLLDARYLEKVAVVIEYTKLSVLVRRQGC